MQHRHGSVASAARRSTANVTHSGGKMVTATRRPEGALEATCTRSEDMPSASEMSSTCSEAAVPRALVLRIPSSGFLSRQIPLAFKILNPEP
eukprot:3578525-Rhodomonas_salina.1